MLPHALTKRLVNHAPPNDVTEGYASDWTIGQLREPAQCIADRIEALMNSKSRPLHESARVTEEQGTPERAVDRRGETALPDEPETSVSSVVMYSAGGSSSTRQ